jgi:hypothetical protein
LESPNGAALRRQRRREPQITQINTDKRKKEREEEEKAGKSKHPATFDFSTL